MKGSLAEVMSGWRAWEARGATGGKEEPPVLSREIPVAGEAERDPQRWGRFHRDPEDESGVGAGI